MVVDHIFVILNVTKKKYIYIYTILKIGIKAQNRQEYKNNKCNV